MRKTNDSSGETELVGGADDRPSLIQNDESARQGLTTSIGAHKRKKRSPLAILKKVESDYKLVKRGNKSLKKIAQTQHKQIRELKSMNKELQQLLAQQALTYADHDTRVEGIENHVINIHTREIIGILARRGSRSGSNERAPTHQQARSSQD